MKTTENIIAEKEADIVNFNRAVAMLKKLSEEKGSIELSDGVTFGVCGRWLDFDYAKREDVVKLLSYIGGKWEKTLSAVEGRIDYVNNEKMVRLWGAYPPGTCRIVEERVLVAEHYEVKKRVICSESDLKEEPSPAP